MLANGETNRLVIFRKRRGVNDEIGSGLRFVTAPETDLVVDQINARAAVGDFVGANDFLELHETPRTGVGHRQVNNGGVFFQAAPVAFKGESFAAPDAKRGEKPPAVDKTGLSGRQADSFDGEKLVVMKNVAMNQGVCLAGSGIRNIVAERGGNRGTRGRRRSKGGGLLSIVCVPNNGRLSTGRLGVDLPMWKGPSKKKRPKKRP